MSSIVSINIGSNQPLLHNTEKQNNTENQLSNILIFSFDEKNAEYDNRYTDNKLTEFITKVNDKNPNIIFICTQNSKSRTDKHLQHLIGKLLPLYYKRFSKVDATRQSNLKKLYYRNLRNVRTRIYYNSNTVGFQENIFNRFSNQSYSKKSVFNFSNNSNNTNVQRSTITKYYGNKIEIVYYKYRRYTAIGEDGRNGTGGIMTCINLKKNDIEYKYIVCNFVGVNKKNIINKIYKINNNINYSTAYSNKYNLMYNEKPTIKFESNRYSIGYNKKNDKDLLFNNENNTELLSNTNINNNSDLLKIFLYFISANGLEKFKTTSKKNSNKSKNKNQFM